MELDPIVANGALAQIVANGVLDSDLQNVQCNEWLSINNSCPNCRTYWDNNNVYIVPSDDNERSEDN